MPKRLLDRRQPECIREFRASARQRSDDAMPLDAAGRRTGAIYLWGYSAEMILKAAYFALRGLSENTPITLSDVFSAIDHGRLNYQIHWPNTGKGHNVRAWSELLVAERAVTHGNAYTPRFSRTVQVCGQRIGRLWSETLRYHKNVAYLHEVAQVREAAEWFLTHANLL